MARRSTASDPARCADLHTLAEPTTSSKADVLLALPRRPSSGPTGGRHPGPRHWRRRLPKAKDAIIKLGPTNIKIVDNTDRDG